MKLYQRLVLGTFLRNLGYTIVGALVLFTLVDLFDHLGSLLDNQATIGEVVRYYLYRGAYIVDTVLPIALLLGTIFTIGSMARYLELTALYACGLSLMTITRPILVTGLLFALAAMAFEEFVLPATNERMWHVWEVEIHKRPDTLRPTRQIAATGPDGRIYYARKYDPNTQVATGFKVVGLQDAVVRERLDASRAQWDGQHWVLHDATRRIFRGDREEATHFETLNARDLEITPDGLYHEQVRPENMNIRQLLRQRDLVSQTGGDPVRLDVDVQFKLAFPFVNLIVVFLGVILASAPRKASIASGFGWTVLVGFGYYILMNFGRALGHSEVLPPIVAGWAGNAIYALGTWILFWRAQR